MGKQILFLSIILCMAVSSIAYAGEFGYPEPTAKEESLAITAGYFYHTAEWNPNDLVNFEKNKIRQNEAYLQVSYGFVKNWEVYLRAGGADLKADNAFDGESLGKGLLPFGTAGIKGIVYSNAGFAIGPFVQGTLASTYKDTETSLTTSTAVKYKRPWEVDAGVGLQLKINDYILYGGPVVYWAQLKVDKETTFLFLGTTTSVSTTYEEEGLIGGFAGVKIPLGKGLSIQVEAQQKSKFSIGGAVAYAF